jgi:hemolysin III
MREPVNAISHLVACLLSIGGAVYLVTKTWQNAPACTVVLIYGGSLALLYGASGLYHAVRASPRVLSGLRKLDHSAIYLLIAGTYTPVLYFGLVGKWRLVMLALIWTLTILGVVLKVALFNLPRSWSTMFYVFLGWLAVVPFIQLWHSLPPTAIALLVTGGLCYTGGALIYATKCCDLFPHRFGFHEVFHMFTIFGSAAHFAMVVQIIP